MVTEEEKEKEEAAAELRIAMAHWERLCIAALAEATADRAGGIGWTRMRKPIPLERMNAEDESDTLLVGAALEEFNAFMGEGVWPVGITFTPRGAMHYMRKKYIATGQWVRKSGKWVLKTGGTH